jgi:hypothetical protein
VAHTEREEAAVVCADFFFDRPIPLLLYNNIGRGGSRGSFQSRDTGPPDTVIGEFVLSNLFSFLIIQH